MNDQPSAKFPLLGDTRSSIQRNHALIAPDSHVMSALPGWTNVNGVTLITPHMGARFTQLLAVMAADGRVESAPAGVQRHIYVLSGSVEVTTGGTATILNVGDFAYFPPDSTYTIAGTPTGEEARLNVFEKPYVDLPGVERPQPIIGSATDAPAEPFLGDPDAMLATLLPTDPSFDMAVNVFTYQSGAALPFVEVHVMEHGLMMIAGEGIYRLDDRWYPVRDGDTIWMASYCPQWFAAYGKQPAAYIYYKDVNRDPLASK